MNPRLLRRNQGARLQPLSFFSNSANSALGSHSTHELHAWWDAATIAMGHVARWQIGPRKLWIQRLPGEWRIAQGDGDLDSADAALEVAAPAEAVEFAAVARIKRFCSKSDSEQIRVRPLSADRPIVTRPSVELYLPPGEKVTLFVGLPLWFAVETVDPAQRLLDTNLFRPSDTWFGPVGEEGELCYASRTYGRFRLEDVPRWPHRACTAVQILNGADDTLHVERLRIPAPYLALYAGADGRIWTQDVVLERREGGSGFVQLEMQCRAPSFAPGAKWLADARIPTHSGVVSRAFASLLAGI